MRFSREDKWAVPKRSRFFSVCVGRVSNFSTCIFHNCNLHLLLEFWGGMSVNGHLKILSPLSKYVLHTYINFKVKHWNFPSEKIWTWNLLIDKDFHFSEPFGMSLVYGIFKLNFQENKFSNSPRKWEGKVLSPPSVPLSISAPMYLLPT